MGKNMVLACDDCGVEEDADESVRYRPDHGAVLCDACDGGDRREVVEDDGEADYGELYGYGFDGDGEE